MEHGVVLAKMETFQIRNNFHLFGVCICMLDEYAPWNTVTTSNTMQMNRIPHFTCPDGSRMPEEWTWQAATATNSTRDDRQAANAGCNGGLLATCANQSSIAVITLGQKGRQPSVHHHPPSPPPPPPLQESAVQVSGAAGLEDWMLSLWQ